MSDFLDDHRMDDFLSGAFGPTRLQLDFQQWRQQHAEAVEILRSWENEASESPVQSSAEVSVLSWIFRNKFKMAAVAAAAAILVLVIYSGMLDRDDRRLTVANGHSPKTVNGQYDRAVNSDQPEQPDETPGPGKQQVDALDPTQSAHLATAESKARDVTTKPPVASSMEKKSVALSSNEDPSGCQEDSPEVAAPVATMDLVVRVPRAMPDYATIWPPFNGEDIRSISIFNAIETGSSKKRIARVPPKYHRAVFACVAGSRPPEDDSGFDCVWTRETVIELKDGRSFLLSYDVECDAPEFSFRRRGTDTGSTRWSRRLKGLLRILESGKIRVRFVRLEKEQDGEFAVAGSCVHTVTLSIPTSCPDDSGYRYAVDSKIEADGVIALDVELRSEVEVAGSPDASRFDDTVRLSEDELSADGHNRVLRSTRQSILLMTVESHNH